MTFVSFAQSITADQTFATKGYDLRQIGYPLGVAPAGDGQFVYIQYYPKDKNHPLDNFYLQSLKISSYAGSWYHPITSDGQEPMTLNGIERLSDGFFVTGYQYLPKEKRVHTVARFFSPDGKAKTVEPVQISTYSSKAKKGYEDHFILSPEKKRMLWMGENEKQYFFSLWEGGGTRIWGQELTIPQLGKKYMVQDAVVTDEGTPYFLLVNKSPDYSWKDTLLPPILLTYDVNTKEYEEVTVELDSAFTTNIHLGLLNNRELVVTGIYQNGSFDGLKNGVKITENPETWNGVFMKRYRIGEGFELEANGYSEIPKKWLDHFKEGATFTQSELLIGREKGKNGLTLIFEEFYQKGDKVYFYDIGCLGFDLKTGNIKWSQVVSKRQRSRGSGSFLSYVSGVSNGQARFVYLSELGAPGKLMASSVDLRTGKKKDMVLASNEESKYLFFPTSSGMVNGSSMVLVGMGNPNQNDFKLITIGF
ncbi:hypothetical protein N9933_01370 [bacterium]|nr:hypothetical protein [bacterium]